MPWARDHAVADLAVAERPAAMQAHVVEREELVAEPEYGDVTAGNGHHPAPAGDELADLSDRFEFRQTYFRAAGVSVVSRFSPPRM